MGLGIDTTRDQAARRASGTIVRVGRRLWLAADGRTLVEDGDVRAARLWAAGPGEEKLGTELDAIGADVEAVTAATGPAGSVRPVAAAAPVDPGRPPVVEERVGPGRIIRRAPRHASES